MVFVAQQKHSSNARCWAGMAFAGRAHVEDFACAAEDHRNDLPVRPRQLATHLLASFNNIRVDIDTIVAVSR
jgi:hypothetical protein